MYIIMYVDGTEIGRSPFFRTSKVSEEIEELKEKYSDQIKKANSEPQFFIGDAPSAINNFKSLLSTNQE